MASRTFHTIVAFFELYPVQSFHHEFLDECMMSRVIVHVNLFVFVEIPDLVIVLL